MSWRVALAALLLAVGGCGPKPIFRTPDDESTSSSRGEGPVGASRGEVETVAKPWIGTPYCYGGTDRRCIDCSALAQIILGDLGATLPRTVRAQKLVGESVSVKEMGAGDLVFFRLGSTRVNHVGVALDGQRFVHSSTSRGVVVDHLMDDYFSRRFAEVRRVIGD
jgi:cell wall-associated NlpC family hydrolase